MRKVKSGMTRDSPASITAGTYSSLFTDAVNQVAPILAGDFARRGLDWSKEMRQIAKEKKMMADLGLDYSPQPAAPMAPNDPLLDQEDPVPAGANENK